MKYLSLVTLVGAQVLHVGATRSAEKIHVLNIPHE